ncbi:hypothetical protein [Blastococcus atacamensis]|uniref:hypothetical protein n=1 Tax=Blastococcus atacamensis TaxID=2070508 RepID=UPI0012FFE894|nr:hypothetical protein [Blastococcus atacamensis]
MSKRDHGGRLSWTVLGVRMGSTSEQPQRIEMLAALGRMSWMECPPQHLWLDGSAARAVLKAVICRRPTRGCTGSGWPTLAESGG